MTKLKIEIYSIIYIVLSNGTEENCFRKLFPHLRINKLEFFDIKVRLFIFVILGEASRPKSKGAECPICFKFIAWKKDLARHVLIHTGEKPFVCQVCNRAFNDKSNLNKHQIIHIKQNLQSIKKF